MVELMSEEVTMTGTRALPAIFDDSAAGWERALYAFLSEKQRRSGSQRTLDSVEGDVAFSVLAAVGGHRSPRGGRRRGSS